MQTALLAAGVLTVPPAGNRGRVGNPGGSLAMDYRPTWDLATIPDALLRAEWLRRNRPPAPRAKVQRPCPYCGVPFGARELPSISRSAANHPAHSRSSRGAPNIGDLPINALILSSRITKSNPSATRHAAHCRGHRGTP